MPHITVGSRPGWTNSLKALKVGLSLTCIASSSSEYRKIMRQNSGIKLYITHVYDT